MKHLFEKNHKYNVILESIGRVECIWNGEDFYPNENINCKCSEDIYIDGICVGIELNNKYKILAVEEILEM